MRSKGTSFRHGLLKLYYGIMMCGVLRPSICGGERGVYMCVSERGNWSALLAVFGYDSMESGSDKRRLGVMSHIPCPCFLPSGLQMGRGMPCSPVCLPRTSTPSLSRKLNRSWVFHPSLYFSAWPPVLCRILWSFWWRAVKSTRRPLPIHSKMEKKRERQRIGRRERWTLLFHNHHLSLSLSSLNLILTGVIPGHYCMERLAA